MSFASTPPTTTIATTANSSSTTITTPTNTPLPALKINIRRAQASHLPLLVKMQQAMCIETEERELITETITNGLKKALAQPELGARVFIATLSDPEDQQHFQTDAQTPIAMMMNTTEFDLHRNSTIVWFQSVYVEPPFRRRGIFKNFFAFIKNEVQQDPKCCSIRLDVDCTNERAQATYRALGLKLEGVRVVRYTKPGVEPESVGGVTTSQSPSKEQQQQQQQQQQQDSHSLLASTNNSNNNKSTSSCTTSQKLHPPESLKHNIKISRILHQTSSSSLIDQLAKTQFESSSKFFPTTFPSKIKSLERTRQGLQSIIDGTTTGAELYIAELIDDCDDGDGDNNKKNNNNKDIINNNNDVNNKNETHVLSHRHDDNDEASRRCLLGSCVLTHEWSDWRNGLVLNCFGSFATSSEEENLRAECLRAFIRHFKERTLNDENVSGIRFSYEEAVEMNLKGEFQGKSDHACEEEGMFVERYYLMRYDK